MIEEDGIPEMSTNLDMLDKLKERVRLAQKIDHAQHQARKRKHDRSWVRQTAEAMEIELDSDFARCAPMFLINFRGFQTKRPFSDSQEGANGRTRGKQDVATAALKNELKQLLSQPLLARGISAKYITSGARSVADDLMHGKCACSCYSVPMRS